MSTTLKINGKVVTVESDDRGLEERLARYAMEVVARQSGAISESGWNLERFIRRSKKHESQIELLRYLVEKGVMTRKQMIRAAGKKDGRQLSGCRGAISKNARASNLPSDWWKDSWSKKEKDYITEIRSDVRQALKAVM